MRDLDVGDKIVDSPVGAGEITDFTERGYPRVNRIAVAWLRRLDGYLFGRTRRGEEIRFERYRANAPKGESTYHYDELIRELKIEVSHRDRLAEEVIKLNAEKAAIQAILDTLGEEGKHTADHYRRIGKKLAQLRDTAIVVANNPVGHGGLEGIRGWLKVVHRDLTAMNLEVPETVTELRVCEIDRLFLHPNQLYRFTTDEACTACRDYATQSAPPRVPE